MPSNQRIIWAVKAAAIAPYASTSYTAVKGLQSAGASLDFDLIAAFELGQSALYENIEKIPEVSLTMEKLLDGTPLLYHLATRGYPTNTLQGRANQRCQVAISLFGDTNASASGAQVAEITHSGMYISSVGYQFPVDGNFTESVTLVGNNRVFKTSGFTFTGGFVNTDTPVFASGGVNRREDFIFDCTDIAVDTNGQVITSTATILPPDVAGITSSGTNGKDGFGNYACSIENISVNISLGRDALFELGHKAPYFRPVNFPAEVTTEVEVISKSGDNVSALETGILTGNDAGNNLKKRSIRIYVREGTFINLGTNNKLTNININGADTGGGNETITYQFSTYDDFVVSHPTDPG